MTSTKAILMMPKTQMVLALGLIALSSNNLLVIALSVSSALIADFLFTKLRPTPPFLLSAALVSGLIIGLLTSPTLPWYVPILAGILAMAFKNFLRINDQHIFNPAAAGLFASHFILGQGISWWAVSWQQSLIPILILLTPALVSALYMKRWKIILPFLIIYALAHQTYFDPTVIFFATVMLPEPKTSPNDTWKQIAFGSAVALASGFLNFVDPLIVSLLLGNLAFFILKRYNLPILRDRLMVGL